MSARLEDYAGASSRFNVIERTGVRVRWGSFSLLSTTAGRSPARSEESILRNRGDGGSTGCGGSGSGGGG